MLNLERFWIWDFKIDYIICLKGIYFEVNPIKANLSMCEESAAIGIQIQMVLPILLGMHDIVYKWYLLGCCGLSGILYALSCF